MSTQAHLFNDEIDGLTYCARCGWWQGVATGPCIGQSEQLDLIGMVREFHAKVGQLDSSSPDISHARDLRLSLIDEERKELGLALDANNVTEVSDALADLLYVVIGSALQWGIPIERVFREVHRSNMTKHRDHKRADGKILKGPNYSPPDLSFVGAVQRSHQSDTADLAHNQRRADAAEYDLTAAQQRIAELTSKLSVCTDRWRVLDQERHDVRKALGAADVETTVQAAERCVREMSERIADRNARVLYLEGLINTPHTDDFLRALQLEAAHQIKRWGVEHDAGKRAEDWIALVVYLLGKATKAHYDGDAEKLKHRIITVAAVGLNWFRALTGDGDAMRPGVAPRRNVDLVDALVHERGLDR